MKLPEPDNSTLALFLLSIWILVSVCLVQTTIEHKRQQKALDTITDYLIYRPYDIDCTVNKDGGTSFTITLTKILKDNYNAKY